MLEKVEIIYEGKAKKVFKTNQENIFIQEFKDDATAFNAEKKGTIQQKGVVNNTVSSILFQYLASNGIQTHFIEKISDREMAMKCLKIIPIEFVVRNIVAGSLKKRTGIEDGTTLPFSIVETYYKDDKLGDPIISDDHIKILNIIDQPDLDQVKKTCLKINELLKKAFAQIEIDLVDFKLEFGRDENGQILLGDEISPDTCRLWDTKTREKMDKDRFRFDLGKVEEKYQEVLKRVKSLENKLK